MSSAWGTRLSKMSLSTATVGCSTISSEYRRTSSRLRWLWKLLRLGFTASLTVVCFPCRCIWLCNAKRQCGSGAALNAVTHSLAGRSRKVALRLLDAAVVIGHVEAAKKLAGMLIAWHLPWIPCWSS